MPLYEYRCGNCGKSCEILQKMSESPATACPECGKDQLKRQVSAPRFKLTGTGWYETDFKGTSKSAQPTEKDPQDSSDKGQEKPAETNTSTEKEKPAEGTKENQPVETPKTTQEKKS